MREGTTNLIRHSGARHCDIQLTREAGENGEAGEICAKVSDDGCGLFPARDRTDGSGNLAKRVVGFAGADFEVGPLSEGGFRLCVSLPLRNGSVREYGW